MTPVRIATRGSELALWQARFIASKLGRESELVVISTRGDRDQASSLAQIGGQGIFVKEVQAAVLDGRADLAVHSAKDLPAISPDGLAIGAFPERGDVRDALVGKALGDLQSGEVIATGSLRRQVQLKFMRPDLEFASLRGNIATRVAVAQRYGAVVVAYAALERLGMLDAIAQVFEPSEMIPQVGQGALAVECRSSDGDLRACLADIDDPNTRLAVESERSFLERLGSGCSLPVGAYATVDPAAKRIDLIAFIGLPDASFGVNVAGSGFDPHELGTRLCQELLAKGGLKVLDQLGAGGSHD